MENNEFDFEKFAMRLQLKHESYNEQTIQERFNLIRRAYDYYMPFIMKGRISPYFLEWDWTPIEFQIWADIRRIGLPLYPQVPVFNYFLDFADPVKKIAIEADGKDWHMNKEKDRKRDEKIKTLGWQIFRVPGHMTYTHLPDFLLKEGFLEFDQEQMDLSRWYNKKTDWFSCRKGSDDLFEKWVLNSSEGLTIKLKEEYYFPRHKGYKSDFTDEYFNGYQQ